MAINIAFQNSGLALNPGFEDILDPDGLALTDALLHTYTIVNDTGGAYNDYKFVLNLDNSNTTIVGVTLLSPGDVVVATASGMTPSALASFLTFLTDPDIGGIFPALDQLLNGDTEITGSGLIDHATTFGLGISNTVHVLGNGGDDVLWGRSGGMVSDILFLNTPVTLVGGLGNDTIRVSTSSGSYVVAGANEDGTGGFGQFNTLEITANGPNYSGAIESARFDPLTNIDGLRFLDMYPPVSPVTIGAANLAVYLNTEQIGIGKVSLSLKVEGSSDASPLSHNAIYIAPATNADIPGTIVTTPVVLDLSGWSFTNWDETRNDVVIETNPAAAVADSIVGTHVADTITTYAGNDTIRGGGGADVLYGGSGDDVFVYGLNEAVSGEQVFGNNEDVWLAPVGMVPVATDRVLVIGDNDFTGVSFHDIDELAFGAEATATFDQAFIGNATGTVIGDAHTNTLNFVLQQTGDAVPAIDLSTVAFESWTKGDDQINITGTTINDSIVGSSQADRINGNGGSDTLTGGKGGDTFVFDVPIKRGTDHIVDFSYKRDLIELSKSVFEQLKRGELSKEAFAYGNRAKDDDVHILYNKKTGVVRYDKDGIGGHKAKIVTILDSDPNKVKHDDFYVV